MSPRQDLKGHSALTCGVFLAASSLFLSSCTKNECPEGSNIESTLKAESAASTPPETAYTTEFQAGEQDVQIAEASELEPELVRPEADVSLNKRARGVPLGTAESNQSEVKGRDVKQLRAGAEFTAPRCRAAGQELATWAKANHGSLHGLLLKGDSRKALFSYQADIPVNPASNMKLLTAAVALELLGGQARFRTSVYGAVKEHRIERLVVKGGGAPDLTTAEFARFARVLAQMQVREVADIVVDQGRFSSAFTPPAFEQQPDEWAPFRAPVSALALDRNVVALNVMSMGAGEDAVSWYEPPIAIIAKGKVKTGKVSTGDRVGWSLTGKAQHLDSSLSGSLAEGLGRRRYRRRLADPRLIPGFALAALLRELGVKVKGSVQLGVRRSEPRITALPSAPLSELILPMGKQSDNFTAEMLLISLSQKSQAALSQKATPWSSEFGAQVLKSYLVSRFKSAKTSVIQNGSGLFDANKIAPRLIVELLEKMLTSGEAPAFLQHLSIAGRDGTLKKRMKVKPLLGRVRAKTGTLAATDALSGYIEAKDGSPPYVFSVLISGVKSQHYEARKRTDAFLAMCIKEADKQI